MHVGWQEWSRRRRREVHEGRHLVRQGRRVRAVTAQDLRRLIAWEEDGPGEDRRPESVEPELE
jgi:hypothetical protein